MPCFSIIVPVYNTKKYLPQCLESLLRQRFSDFEVLVVDDGATDGSSVLCDQYAAKDERIKVIHQENKGLGEARNAGLRYAKGEWILFLDSDDYWAENGLQQLWEGIRRWPNNTLYITQWRILESDAENLGIPHCTEPFPQEGIVELHTLQEKVQFYDNHYGWAVWKLVIHRSLVANNRLCFLPDVRNGEDLYWVLHLLDQVTVFCCLSTVLCCYRDQEKGTLSERSPQNALRWLDSIEKTICQISQEALVEKEFVIAWLINIDTYYFYLAAAMGQKEEWIKRIQRHLPYFRAVKKQVAFLSKKAKLIWCFSGFSIQLCWLLCKNFRAKLTREE